MSKQALSEPQTLVDRLRRASLFDDDRALDEADPDPDEERRKIICMVAGRGLVVIYTEPQDDCFRIISARKATKHDARAYHQG